MWRSTGVRGLVLALGVAIAVGASADDEPVRVGKPHVLRVTHTTRVRVDPGTARLQVWHAKPLPRVWPGLAGPLGVTKATLAPPEARELATRSEGGIAWGWDVAAPPAGEVDFSSTFDMRSADRELRTSGLAIRWADVPQDTTALMKGLPALPRANARMREVVAKLKDKGKDPIETLVACCQWVNGNIAYTPGVTYATDDLDAICTGRGGHCGHRATVYLALCEAAGLPARRVAGYALLNHPRSGTGADDGNRHVWVQVHLPTLGWVEVEPAPHGSPFAISHRFVMCPFDLQARFVSAVSESGARSSPVAADTLHVVEVK